MAHHLPDEQTPLVNPLHPKLKAGAAGLLGGSVIGALIDLLLTRFHWYTDGDSITRTVVLSLIIMVCSQAGHFVAAYWAKWEPAVDTVVSKVTHAVLPSAVADAVDAKFAVWSDALVERLAAMLSAVNRVNGGTDMVSTGTMMSTTSSGQTVLFPSTTNTPTISAPTTVSTPASAPSSEPESTVDDSQLTG